MTYLAEEMINGHEYHLRIPPLERVRLTKSFVRQVSPSCDINDLYLKLVASGDVEERQVAAYVRTLFWISFFNSPRLVDDNFFTRKVGEPKVYYVTQGGADYIATPERVDP